MTPEQIIALAFRDELEKIARRRKLTKEQMLAVIDRLQPTSRTINRIHLGVGRSGRPDAPIEEVRRAYREILRDDAGERGLKVPLKQRLENYKYVKRTGGRLPKIEDWRHHGEGILLGGDSGYRLAGEASDAPLTLYSGGKTRTLASAAQDPQTRHNAEVLMPGQTRTSPRGLYLARRESAEGYAHMPREGGLTAGNPGNPAVLKATVPRHRVLAADKSGGGAPTEWFLPGSNIRRASTSIEEL